MGNVSTTSTVTGAGASYISSAALVNLIQGAAQEHGVSIGPNTATLLSLGLGVLFHWGSNFLSSLSTKKDVKDAVIQSLEETSSGIVTPSS